MPLLTDEEWSQFDAFVEKPKSLPVTEDVLNSQPPQEVIEQPALSSFSLIGQIKITNTKQHHD